jgi:hypothetical protein
MVGRQLMQQEREELRKATVAAASSEHFLQDNFVRRCCFSVGMTELA